MSNPASSKTNSGEGWNRNSDGSWSKVVSLPSLNDKSNWGYFNTKDQEEILAAQENSSFHFHGATKSVDANDANEVGFNSTSSRCSEESVHTCNEMVINNMVEKFSILESELISLRKELRRNKTRISDLEVTVDEQIDNIYVLETQLNRLDQYGRRENVEIVGISNDVNDRDLESEVIKILRAIGLKHIQHFSIVACHRVGSKDRYGRRNTIVRFLNRKDAIQCLKSKRNLYKCQSIGYNNLYVVENLCPAFKSIFEELKQLKDEGFIKQVWSYNGVINYKQSDDEQEKPVKIFHENEVQNIYNELGL